MFRVTVGRLFVLLIFVAMPLGAHAQVLGNLNGVTIDLSPQYPQPGQTIEATVRSGNVDVSSATIVWLLNDEIQQQREGGASFFFQAGALGETQTLTVLVQVFGGQVLSDSIVIEPAMVTLVWEADTFTPPFYKGRALYTSGSVIRAEARALVKDTEGGMYDPKELIYTWRRNDNVLGDHSGLGRSTLVVEGPKFFNDDIISVEVSTPDQRTRGTSAALVATQDPTVLLYEEDPLLGVLYHRSIENNHVFREAKQISFNAVPLYMDALHANDRRLAYEWTIDGTRISADTERPSYLTLSFADENEFSAQARVSIEHVTHLLQSAVSEWLLYFEGGARATPFGR